MNLECQRIKFVLSIETLTIRCVGCESCELIFVNDHASDKLEPVLDVEFVCFLGRDVIRKILSTLLTFNGKR